jgi:hypothetical protein
MRNPLSAAWFVFGALAFAGTCHAEVYKWKDANGHSHYSDQQPIGQEGQKLKSTSPAPNPAPATKTTAEREMEFRKRQLEAEENATKNQRQLAESKERATNCDKARGNLKALESGMRLVKYDDKGEQAYIEDSERPALIAETKKTIASLCP